MGIYIYICMICGRPLIVIFIYIYMYGIDHIYIYIIIVYFDIIPTSTYIII